MGLIKVEVVPAIEKLLPGVVAGHVQRLGVQQEPTPGEEAVLGQHTHSWETHALLQGEVDRHFLGVHHTAILGHPRQQGPAQQLTKRAERLFSVFVVLKNFLLDYLFLLVFHLI